ncbi:MAG: histidine kinase [Nocardioides sp.]|nr:histidine kinase [Nocardioides sp.]
MLDGTATLFGRFRDRIEHKGARQGLVYPWWIPVLSTIGLVGGAGIGAFQRLDVANDALVLLAAAITVGPCVAHFLIRPWLPWWVELPVALLGVGLLVSVPLRDDGAIDFAPLSLAFAVGEITATDGGRRGLLGVGACAGLLLLVGDHDADLFSLYLGELVIGLVFGYMLRWQMRALAAEQTARDEERVRATLAERQRVAREIHDLVAHSLSVTMLHVTGARRALEQDADIPDAIEALTDAERVGREAMADIRRTVSVLATDGTAAPGVDQRPLPGAADLDALVEGFRQAGLDVTWRRDGDLARLSPAAGLALFRVVQESLANVVKHAPGVPADVRLDVTGPVARLTVTNPRLAGAVVGTDGSGVAGMTSRVDQLGGRLEVGDVDDQWRVELGIPVVAP